MAEAGRHFWKSPGLFPLHKQGHLNPITWGSVQIALEYYQGWRLYNPNGKPSWSSTQRKSVSMCSEGTFCISVWAYCHMSCNWVPLKRAWLHPPGILLFRVYTHYWEPPWAFTSPGWAVPSLPVILLVRASVALSSSLWLSKIAIRTIKAPKKLQQPYHDLLSESLASSKLSTQGNTRRQRLPSLCTIGKEAQLPRKISLAVCIKSQWI